MQSDVIIVGAGVSGLCAARTLHRRGVHARVLESRDRVGGRLFSQRVGGDVFDLGGQWIGPKQHRLAALARELKIETFPQFHTGRKILSWNGRIRTFTGDIPRLSILSILELLWARRRWHRQALAIPDTAPWEAKLAAGWDGLTLESWKNKHLWTAGSKLFLDIITRAVFTAEPRDISFLFFLSYLRSGVSLDDLISIPGGAQQDRFVGGAQQIAERLAAELPEPVILSAPVTSITQSGDVVVVSTIKGEFHARRVIVALAPALAGRLHYEPALGADRDALTQRMPMGSVIKYIATYERPFWRERGFSGEAFSDTGPTVTTFDDCSHDGGQAALVSFSDASAARQWSPQAVDERRRAVLSELARFFGPEALHPTSFVEKDWNVDPWSRGCYVGLMTPGTMTSYGRALREPCGVIHWAGTETATEWTGYIEGAIQAGERAANEVAERLGSAPHPSDR